MNEESREAQQELFQEFSNGPKKPERFPSIQKTQKPILISTTMEQLLMTGILFVLVLCGVFFLGVLRGKALTHPILSPATTVQPRAIARPIPMTAGQPISTLPQAKPRQAATTPMVQAVRSAAPTVLSPDKPYTIQVLTHRKKELAEQEVAKLRKMGYTSFIIPSGDYFQVCAGQYATKDEARRDLAFFSTKYKDCFLRHR